MNPTSPIRPLNIGNVVSAGFRLFNDNRKSYLLVALRAVAWLTLILVFYIFTFGLMIGGGMMLAAASTGGGDTAAGGLLLGVGLLLLVFGGIPLVIFCYAKAIYNETLITVNAYGHLTNQPEAMPQTQQRLKKQMWVFWLVKFLVGAILFVVSLACSILQQFATVIGSLFGSDAGAIIGGVLLVATVLLQYGLQFWLSIRLFLPEIVLAIEEEVQNTSSLPRSWKLTAGNTLRIGVILLVAFLITCPLYALTLIPAIALAFALLPMSMWSELAASTAATSPPVALMMQLLVGLGIVFVVYILLTQLVQILVLPFWQTIKAVIYYDLRSRREGLGLSLSGGDR